MRKGFTLIEVIFVCVIIGIIASVTIGRPLKESDIGIKDKPTVQSALYSDKNFKEKLLKLMTEYKNLDIEYKKLKAENTALLNQAETRVIKVKIEAPSIEPPSIKTPSIKPSTQFSLDKYDAESDYK